MRGQPLPKAVREEFQRMDHVSIFDLGRRSATIQMPLREDLLACLLPNSTGTISTVWHGRSFSWTMPKVYEAKAIRAKTKNVSRRSPLRFQCTRASSHRTRTHGRLWKALANFRVRRSPTNSGPSLPGCSCLRLSVLREPTRKAGHGWKTGFSSHNN
jgi:hypothetical protein